MLIDFKQRKIAANYLRHFNFHQIGSTGQWSNGEYKASMYSYMTQSKNGKKVINTSIEFYPISSILTSFDIKRNIEDKYYAEQEAAIIAG